MTRHRLLLRWYNMTKGASGQHDRSVSASSAAATTVPTPDAVSLGCSDSDETDTERASVLADVSEGVFPLFLI